MLIPKTSESVMLNLFQHLDPKIRCALKSKNPLNAAKSRPWSFVKEHGPVLREERFFDATRPGSWFFGTRSRNKFGMTINGYCERPDSVIPTKLLVGIWMLLLYRSNQERRTWTRSVGTKN
ncbi:hypothetical protein Y696_03760 [Mesotoga sp. H07pep.5.4]|nr:hypothetical protein Y696_03760 [Mesotoga sp. H07pep.5.4]